MKIRSRRARSRNCLTTTLPGWTRALMLAGLVGAPSAGRTEIMGTTVMSAVSPGISLSGYVDTSYVARLGEASASGADVAFPNRLRSPGRLYDNETKQNNFNLNVVSLVLDRPMGDEDWAAGFHVQTLFGPDAVLRNAYSLTGGPTDFAVNEAYLKLRVPLGNGLETRFGYFNSPLGYEVFDGGRNPNVSRSYGYYLEPKAHTGLTMSYPFTESVSVMGGVANSYSPFVDARPAESGDFTYLGMITVNGSWFGDPDTTFTFGYTGGHTATGAPTDDGPRIHSFYAGLHLPLPMRGLAIGVTYDYQANFAAAVPAVFFFPAGPKHTYANALGFYVEYAREKWEWNTRVEYATGTAGNTILVNYDPFGSNKPMFDTHDDKFLGVTTTVGYHIWENVLSRVEFRWDRDLAGGVPAFGSAADPRQNSFTVALNLIYSF